MVAADVVGEWPGNDEAASYSEADEWRHAGEDAATAAPALAEDEEDIPF